MRKCSLCKVEDKPQMLVEPCNCQGGNVLGHSAGCNAIEHFVKPEIRFLKSETEFGDRYKRQGWEFIWFQTRPAMQRLTCTDCLRAQAEADRRMKHYRKLAQAAEGNDQLNCYQILCQ